jgi:AraC-like DNA-binding protein
VSQDDRGSATGAEQREHVLPNGAVHVVFRLSGPALRVFEGPEDRVGRRIGTAIVGGARSGYYVRDVSEPVWSVGAELMPGAAPLLLGVPADEFAERHTPLEDLWGREAGDAHERLAFARSAEQRLALLESIFAARLPRVRGIHPAIAEALARFDRGVDVASLVARSGVSHRRFLDLFRSSVGLAPKRYARVARFRAALARIATGPAAPSWAAAKPSWADLALAAGYSDQSHFNREFREFAGVTPGHYRDLAPLSPHHVPLRDQVNFVQSRGRAIGQTRQ